jgi:DNA-binding transcriptional MerR regulator
MKSRSTESLSIGELAERAGVSRRTVRYYVQLGLIPPPEGLGRGATYSRAHLEEIERVRRLQQSGLELDAIRSGAANSSAVRPPPIDVGRFGVVSAALGGPSFEHEASPRTVHQLVLRAPIADGVRLEIDVERLGVDRAWIERLASECARAVASMESPRERGNSSARESVDQTPPDPHECHNKGESHAPDRIDG